MRTTEYFHHVSAKDAADQHAALMFIMAGLASAISTIQLLSTYNDPRLNDETNIYYHLARQLRHYNNILDTTRTRLDTRIPGQKLSSEENAYFEELFTDHVIACIVQEKASNLRFS